MADEVGLNLLLTSLIETNKQLFARLDQALDRMATKEDIDHLRDEIQAAVSKEIFDLQNKETERRLHSLEVWRGKIWPSILAAASLIIPAICWGLAHIHFLL
jgi:hypothetical protein